LSRYAGAEGSYTVDADPSVYNGSFIGVDHTSGAGNFLLWMARLYLTLLHGVNSNLWSKQLLHHQLLVSSLVTQTLQAFNFTLVAFLSSDLSLRPPAPAHGSNTTNLSIRTFGYSRSVSLWYAHWLLQEMISALMTSRFENVNATSPWVQEQTRACATEILYNSMGAERSLISGAHNTLSCLPALLRMLSASTTTYYVTVSGPGGCVALDSALVTVFQPLIYMPGLTPPFVQYFRAVARWWRSKLCVAATGEFE